MLKNYFILALRVLKRRKFFTFITLFGISFTLGILMVLISFMDSSLGSVSPLSQKDDMVYIGSLRLSRYHYDTTMVIDTVMRAERVVFDTTYNTTEAGSSNWNSDANNQIFENYLSDLSSMETMCLLNSSNEYVVFKEGVKIEMDVLLSDQNYWEIFDHTFLEGRSFDEQETESASPVVVISSETAEKNFGRETGVLDEEIELDGKMHKVIGVYEHIGKVVSFVSPDAVIPYTHQNLANQTNFYHGNYSAMYLASESSSATAVKSDLLSAMTTIPLDHPDNESGFTEAVVTPMTFNEMFARGIYYDSDPTKSLRIMTLAFFGILTFFIILPTLNLINLNISRILERASEIGVRKAFGASSSQIMGQFIVENVIQTLLGGFIGLIIAVLLIQLINGADLLAGADLVLNLRFFVIAFVVTLVFGILSGLLPSLKMSKMQIVNALKQSQL